MAKISLAGFKDPARRPRYIIWTGVAVMVLAAVMIVALGVTSTYWFCAEGCHKVQDDTITAYNRSTHSQVSCMACHMPVQSDPVTFILHKAEALGELYLTVTGNYELPLNGESHVALTMGSNQCTQCHNLGNREVTPRNGVLIDHEAHAEVNAACSTCHNRVGHKEDFELALKDPKTGEPNTKHADFMSMTACFRCHDLEKNAAAPGACSACHPADFNLVPDSHRKGDFYPKGHAEMAKEMKAESDKARGGAEGEGDENAESGEKQSLLGPDKAFASGGEEKEKVAKEEVPELLEASREAGADSHANVGAELPSVESVFYCSTCHVEKFCTDCHGMEMPHPAAFKEPKDAKDPAGHPAISKDKKAAEKCVMCHGQNQKTFFCDSCHHGTAVKYEFDTKAPWTTQQHPKAVAASGIAACTEKCHTTKFCQDCHTGRKVIPGSHKKANWTRPKGQGAITAYGTSPAKISANHALDAQKSMESCAICHGTGGANAKFCKSCHKLEMPHPAEFKTNHVSSKKNPAACRNCHTFKELCSNCHHVGSSTKTPWINVHGGSVNKNGAEGCLKCHGGEGGTSKDFCINCHNARKAVPASHRAKTFVRDFSPKKAGHVQQFSKNADSCTYCHKGEAAQLASAKFCTGCHKLPMPHQITDGSKQKFQHANENGGMVKGLSKAQCSNCHQQRMCDSCHHTGSVANKPWVRYHPNIVKKNGAQPCFECHDPTFCSNCHVNLAKKGLL